MVQSYCVTSHYHTCYVQAVSLILIQWLAQIMLLYIILVRNESFATVSGKRRHGNIPLHVFPSMSSPTIYVCGCYAEPPSLLMVWFQFPSCFLSLLRNTSSRQKRELPCPLHCLKGGAWYNHVLFVTLKVGVYFLFLVKRAHTLGFYNILAECSQGPRVSWQHCSIVPECFTFRSVSKCHRTMSASLICDNCLHCLWTFLTQVVHIL